MKIGKTNAIAISGGTTKTPYEEWQEGFGYNWDSVVANAPMTNSQRILHVYTKVELLKMSSNFPTGAEIYAFNGSVYRPLTMDENKCLSFIPADYITNTSDNIQYVCVVYGNASWGSLFFQTYLPVVYSNSKSCNNVGAGADTHVNLLNNNANRYPLIRGYDVYFVNRMDLYAGVEHLTTQSYNTTVDLGFLSNISDCEARILKEIIDNAPIETTFNFLVGQTLNLSATITDEDLANWFYNTFFYKWYDKTFYIFGANNVVRRFKLNPNLLLNSSLGYVSNVPDTQYFEGTITENQTATIFIGYHGFRGSATKYQQQKNFPLWTVLEGASTGCLRPLQVANTNGSFLFSSLQLERSNFALFNNGVIDNDPTKSFVANLPVLPTDINGNVIVPQTIRFEDTTFKNQFTENERNKIVSKITTDKHWGLTW
jgi:hypothetical protein